MALPFSKLVIVDILLYSAALALEFAALIALRLRRPEMIRPLRVPGGWPGAVLVTLAPMTFAAVVAWKTLGSEKGARTQLLIALVMMSAGSWLYLVRRAHAKILVRNVKA